MYDLGIDIHEYAKYLSPLSLSNISIKISAITLSDSFENLFL